MGQNIRTLIEKGSKNTQYEIQEQHQTDPRSLFTKIFQKSQRSLIDKKRLKMSNLSDLQIKNPRLSKLRTEWEALGITRNFLKVHHSYRVPDSEKRETLYGFIKYCDIREIKEENLQTLERALNLASLVKNGEVFESALEKSWAKCPRIGR